MGKKKYIYADEKSIQSIDRVLNLATKILETDNVIINDKKIVPPLVGAALSGALGVGSTAALGLGGTAGLATTGFGTGALAATGGAIASASLVAVALPIAAIASVGFLVFKNKKEKKLHNMRLARYKEAVEKQNKAIKKFMDLDKKREQKEKELQNNNEELRKENLEIRNKLNEVRAINESLLAIIAGLGKDLDLVA
jgi:hypothetical protein